MDGEVVTVLLVVAASIFGLFVLALVAAFALAASPPPPMPPPRDVFDFANLNLRRLFGLLALNGIGIHGFDALPVIAFNKPAKFWDGTETLSYSYRLNVSYHPRNNYQKDIRALGEQTLVLVGANDEAIDPDALRTVIAADAPQAQITILPGVNHFGIFSDPAALKAVAGWLRSLPPGAGH